MANWEPKLTGVQHSKPETGYDVYLFDPDNNGDVLVLMRRWNDLIREYEEKTFFHPTNSNSAEEAVLCAKQWINNNWHFLRNFTNKPPADKPKEEKTLMEMMLVDIEPRLTETERTKFNNFQDDGVQTDDERKQMWYQPFLTRLQILNDELKKDHSQYERALQKSSPFVFVNPLQEVKTPDTHDFMTCFELENKHFVMHHYFNGLSPQEVSALIAMFQEYFAENKLPNIEVLFDLEDFWGRENQKIRVLKNPNMTKDLILEDLKNVLTTLYPQNYEYTPNVVADKDKMITGKIVKFCLMQGNGVKHYEQLATKEEESMAKSFNNTSKIERIEVRPPKIGTQFKTNITAAPIGLNTPKSGQAKVSAPVPPKASAVTNKMINAPSLKKADENNPFDKPSDVSPINRHLKEVSSKNGSHWMETNVPMMEMEHLVSAGYVTKHPKGQVTLTPAGQNRMMANLHDIPSHLAGSDPEDLDLEAARDVIHNDGLWHTFQRTKDPMVWNHNAHKSGNDRVAAMSHYLVDHQKLLGRKWNPEWMYAAHDKTNKKFDKSAPVLPMGGSPLQKAGDPFTLDYRKINPPKRTIPPPKNSIDYSKDTRPTDSTSGSVAPLNNPFQHGSGPKAAGMNKSAGRTLLLQKARGLLDVKMCKAERSDKEESCIMDVKAQNEASGKTNEEANPWAICKAAMEKSKKPVYLTD